MKDLKLDKIVLKKKSLAAICLVKRISWYDLKIGNVKHPNLTEILT
jgi:hypothetical protein